MDSSILSKHFGPCGKDEAPVTIPQDRAEVTERCLTLITHATHRPLSQGEWRRLTEYITYLSVSAPQCPYAEWCGLERAE